MNNYKLKKIGESTLDLPKNLLSNSLLIINSILTSLIKGVSNVSEKIGETANTLGENISVVVHSVSNTTIKLSDKIFKDIGTVVQKIPLIGNSSAYIIKSGSDGVYFLVISVSEITQFVSKLTGKTIKNTSEVFILTLGETNKITDKTAKDVKKISDNIFNRGKHMIKSRKNNKRNLNSSKKKRNNKK